MQIREDNNQESSTDPKWFLRLYVTGATPASIKAVAQASQMCETHLQGRYKLEVINIHQRSTLTGDEKIVATPTLIKILPPPLQRFIGDFARTNVLFGIDVLGKG